MKQVIMEVDKPNRNGRTYPKEAIENALKTVKEPVLCALGPPDGPSVDLQRVAAYATNLRVEDGKFMADITVAKTPMGKVLMELSDVPHAYTSIGFGDIDKNGVVSNYTFTGIAIVPKKDGA